MPDYSSRSGVCGAPAGGQPRGSEVLTVPHA